MTFEVAPENTFYFATGFFLSTVLGTFFLLSYKRTWLNYLNSLLFFISAFRFLTEYLLQEAPNYNSASLIFDIHNILGHLFFVSTWTMLYFYVKPFRNWKYNLQMDFFVGVFILLLPCIILDLISDIF